MDFEKLIADLDGDNTVNFKDFAIMANCWGDEDRRIADVSGPNGIPDCKVAYHDSAIVSRDWLGP